MSSAAAEAFAKGLRQSVEHFNARDYDAAFVGLAPDVEWHFADWLPDLDVINGRDELVRTYMRLVDVGEWRVEILDVAEVEPGVMLVHQRGAQTGRTTGIVTERESFLIYELGPEGVTRLREFATRDEALTSVGA